MSSVASFNSTITTIVNNIINNVKTALNSAIAIAIIIIFIIIIVIIIMVNRIMRNTRTVWNRDDRNTTPPTSFCFISPFKWLSGIT